MPEEKMYKVREMKERIILLGVGAKQAESAAAILKGLDVEVESVAVQATDMKAVLNGSSILLIPFSDEKTAYRSLVALLRASNGSSSVILLAETGSEKLLSLASGDLVDQVVFDDRPESLIAAVKSELEKRRLARSLEHLHEKFNLLKRRYSHEARRFFAMEGTFDATLENFMTALDLRDVETFGHSKTVARYSLLLAETYGIRDPARLDNIRKGALLHDVGKIAVPDAILNKPGPLNDQEWEIVRRHPELGFGLVKNVGMVEEIGNIILYHHEKFDGSGYPRGLRGKDIPLEARIFAVADSLDAITSPRPYRRSRDFDMAREEIVFNSGTQFDPEIVEAFLKHGSQVWERIRYETTRLMPGFEKYIARNREKTEGSR